jgi:CPA2 family monovalent cation:H+ antiporter-2
MLLMFGVGLHFSLDDLLAVQADCGARCGAADGAVATVLGMGTGLVVGLELGNGLMFGLSLSAPARWCCSRRWKPVACWTP